MFCQAIEQGGFTNIPSPWAFANKSSFATEPGISRWISNSRAPRTIRGQSIQWRVLLAVVGQQAFIDRIRATPSVSGHGRLNDVPAHFDTALIRAEDERGNEATKGTYLEGKFELVLDISF